MAGAFPVNATFVALIAGVLFTLFTLLGIRALSIIGMISVPLFLVLGIIAAVQASAHAASIWAYQGTQTGSLALGVGVTLVFALFADSGTMTADFTRWAKTPRQAWIATSTAFPVGNLIAMLVGGVIAASTAGSGDVFSLIAENGGVLAVIAVVFLFVNLGSVCTHCLYNSAVGWSSVTNGKMRILTLVLGAVGTTIAVLGIWGMFIGWLTLLGILVPPIGAIIIADQFLTRHARTETIQRVRWQPFVAWGIGSGLALAANLMVPEFSTIVIGLVFSAGSYLVLTKLTQPARATAVSMAN
jgi:cytosine permease